MFCVCYMVCTEQNLEPCFTEQMESHSPDSAYSSHMDAEMAVTPDQNSTVVVEDIGSSRPTPIHNVIVLRSSDEFYNINRSSATVHLISLCFLLDKLCTWSTSLKHEIFQILQIGALYIF